MDKAALTFIAIMKDLCKAVAAQGAKGAFGPYAITRLLWTRLNRGINRIAILARQLAENGPPPPPKPRTRRRKPEAEATSGSPAGRAPKPRPEFVLPRRFGWVLAVWETRGYAAQFNHLLSQPEMIAMIEADPRFGRTLRPICHILGIRPPPCLQRPKPTPKPTPKPKPKPAKPARKRRKPRAPKPAPAFRLILDPVRPAQAVTPSPSRNHPRAPPVSA